MGSCILTFSKEIDKDVICFSVNHLTLKWECLSPVIYDSIQLSLSINLYLYGMINICKASAGSGKTFKLVGEYLRLALKGDYRKIQAVTFTNKATLEMKERIIAQLYILCTETEKSPYCRLLLGIEDEDEPIQSEACIKLRQRAQEVLRRILIEYKNFRVSTIDSFFQEVVRNFTRELNIKNNFQVELDNERILDQAAKAILINAQRSGEALSQEEHSSSPMSWLLKSTKRRMADGYGHNPLRIIGRLANELTKEGFQEKFIKGTGGVIHKFPELKDIEELERNITNHLNNIKSGLSSYSTRVLGELKSIGLNENMLAYKKSGGLAPFFKISNGNYSELTSKRFEKASEDIKSLVANKEQAKWGAILEASQLPHLLNEYQDYTNRIGLEQTSLQAIYDLLPSFGLIKSIQDEVNKITQEEHSLLISSTAQLISQVLDDSDGPSFIYEKLGTEINSYMIDEFQDTSRLQYNNFRPLLEESLSNGHDNLIVGDVKQSIYRWRGGDSSLLGEQVNAYFREMVHLEPLNKNFRSAPQIIKFNNLLYHTLIDKAQHLYKSSFTELFNGDEEAAETLLAPLSSFFQDYQTPQEIPDSKEKAKQAEGAVVIHEYTRTPTLEEPYEPLAILQERIPNLVIDLQQRGLKANEIAILVRTREQAKAIAEILTKAKEEALKCETIDLNKYSLDFVSDEALAPLNILTIDFILAILKLMINDSDDTARKEVETMYFKIAQQAIDMESVDKLLAKGYRSLYETIELVIEHFSELFYDTQEGERAEEAEEKSKTSETAYLIKFLDTALSYQQDRSKSMADFISMWQDTAHKMRLNMPEDERKIQIQTIHKSKGLEYRAVLIPFLNWEMKPKSRNDNYQWVDMPEALKSICGEAVSCVPIRVSKDLLNSFFAASYIHEVLETAQDSINILYVASTRAVQELHIWLLPDKLPSDKKKEDIPSEMINLVMDTMPNLALEQEQAGETLYQTLGHLEPLSTLNLPQYKEEKSKGNKTSDEQNITISNIQSFEAQDRIAELREGLAHFDKRTKRDEGIIMHEILSQITTAQDLDKAIQVATLKGYLAPERSDALQTFLSKLITQEHTRAWFDGSGRVLNENPILGDNLSYRPDRIIIYSDRADIIDYKFGVAKSQHREQVLNYGYLLRKILGEGFQVRTYLWYIDLPQEQDEIIEVYS